MSDQPTIEKALSVDETKVVTLFGCLFYLFGFVFSTIFFLVGAVFLWITINVALIEFNSAKSWIETPCIITQSEVKGGENPRALISYSYDFEDRAFTSEQFSLMKINTDSRVELERLIARYPLNSKQVCYVNPEFPSEAVLDRTPQPVMWYGLISIPFILIGMGGYYVLFNIDRWKKSSRDHSGSMTNEQRSLNSASAATTSGLKTITESDYDDDDLTESPGPITLATESNGLVLFVFLTVFALFWNGFVGTQFVLAVSDVLKNGWQSPEFFLAFFLIPFVLVGIGVGCGAVYCGLALFNPVPTMVLSRQLIPLGGSASVSWSFRGSSHSIKNLKLILKAAEEATYRRGTDTTTDTETFLELTVFESIEQLDISEGTTSFTIPTNTMHSFNGGNNKIKWTINIHGDIPVWPDVNAAFPIRVVPHE